TENAQNTNVLDSLADGGKHGIHDAKGAANCQNDGDEGDCPEKRLIGPVQLLKIVGFALGLEGGFLEVLRQVLGHDLGLGSIARAQDKGRIVLFAENVADELLLGPDLRIEGRSRRLQNPDNNPFSRADLENVADLKGRLALVLAQN